MSEIEYNKIMSESELDLVKSEIERLRPLSSHITGYSLVRGTYILHAPGHPHDGATSPDRLNWTIAPKPVEGETFTLQFPSITA